MKTSRLIGLAMVLVWLAQGVRAQPGSSFASHARTAATLDGLWRGKLLAPGGALDLSVSMVRLTGGSYFAALDVPVQKLNRIPIDVRQPTGTDSVVLLVSETSSRFLGRRSPDGQELSGLWCRQGQRTPITLHHEAFDSSTPTDAVARFTPPYQVEEVIVTSYTARLRLAGSLTLPPGTGPFPAVVLVSDFGQQDRDGLTPGAPVTMLSYRMLGTLADYLTRRGIAVLRLDDRGTGQSGGSGDSATPIQRAGDLQAALNYLRTRPEIDLMHLGVIGHGEGANVALLVAASPLPPAFVVGLGTYGLPGHETLLLQQEQVWRAQKLPPVQFSLRVRRQQELYDIIRNPANLAQTQTIVANMLHQSDPALSAAEGQRQTAALLTPWHRSFLSFDPTENIYAVQCPVLLITGQADEQAPPARHLPALKQAFKASGNRLLTMYRPKGINHLMQPPLYQWNMLGGEPKPTFDPGVQEFIRRWVVGHAGN
ncbi:alpha/beta hydrolase [Hymenobacter sp. BRD67]|uniref:alpha/beta hydrolase n=1 Tax=Hymenobacter sp. BRD67 TaxID=2675877 RepID=UPI0015671F26|nr:alpha/beta hydrolase [Hymenobacter sp. BRD67]QKG53609.1 alpha/beta hydrolase [Hymenobacter sp. BRD67]